MEEAFGDFRLEEDVKTIPVECFFMPKAVSDALEVADFIMHVVGRQARNRLKGQEGFVRHFAAVFHTVDAKLASFISVDRVEAISRT
jgi:hypothetical protein